MILHVRPHDPELFDMLRDLYQRMGWPTVCALLAVPDSTLCEWMWGTQNPNSVARKAVWLVWSLLLRPGQIQTAFDIATCGRYTESGGPQHAGQAIDHPVELPIKPPPIKPRRVKKNKPAL